MQLLAGVPGLTRLLGMTLHLPVVVVNVLGSGTAGHCLGLLQTWQHIAGHSGQPHGCFGHPVCSLVPSKTCVAGHPVKLHVAVSCHESLGVVGEDFSNEAHIVPRLCLLQHLRGGPGVCVDDRCVLLPVLGCSRCAELPSCRSCHAVGVIKRAVGIVDGAARCAALPSALGMAG